MMTKSFTFVCAYCGATTRSSVEIAPTTGKPGKKITITRYCQQAGCQKLNMLIVPDNWDFRPLALGDQIELVGVEEDGSPILQGKKG